MDYDRMQRPRSNNMRGASSSRGGARRAPQGRNAQAGGPPRWAYVAMIAVPLIGIAILGGVKLTRKAEEPPPAPQVVDPNKQISELTSQVRTLETEFSKLDFRSEGADAKAKLAAYRTRLMKWRDEWDALFKDMHDAKGNLLPEYRGYQAPRNKVNQILSDLNRLSGF